MLRFLGTSSGGTTMKAAYRNVACEIAKALGQTKHASLLEKTLAEETQTDQKLADLAKNITTQANQEDEDSEEQHSSTAGKKTTKHAA
jgi:hypothetical protein